MPLTPAHSSLQIRIAKQDDSPILATLSGQLGYPTTAEQAHLRLTNIEHDPGQAVYVAEVDSEIIGFVHVLVAHRLVTDSFAELGALVVADNHQARGVGKALLQSAEHWARAQGYRWMCVRSNTLRSGAKGFYLHLGYQLLKSQNVFEKALKANGSKTLNRGDRI